VLDETLDSTLLASARREAHLAVEELFGSADAQTGGAGTPPHQEIADAASRAVRRALARALGFRPVTTATVLRVRG
jgi:hypothetical protein